MQIALYLRALGQPERLKILLVIGHGEACVCHLEAALDLRQAYISQHLMALRQAGIVAARREGRRIFYRLGNPDLLDFIQQAGRQIGFTEEEITALEQPARIEGCPCPHCNVDGTLPQYDHMTLSTIKSL